MVLLLNGNSAVKPRMLSFWYFGMARVGEGNAGIFSQSKQAELAIYTYLNPPRVWNLSPLTIKNRPAGWNLTPMSHVWHDVSVWYWRCHLSLPRKTPKNMLHNFRLADSWGFGERFRKTWRLRLRSNHMFFVSNSFSSSSSSVFKRFFSIKKNSERRFSHRKTLNTTGKHSKEGVYLLSTKSPPPLSSFSCLRWWFSASSSEKKIRCLKVSTMAGSTVNAGGGPLQQGLGNKSWISMASVLQGA